jgi:hypothetical protein
MGGARLHFQREIETRENRNVQDVDELIELQVCDAEMVRVQAEIALLPRRIGELETALAVERKKLATAEAGLKAEDAVRRKQESDVADQQIKIRKYRAQTDSVTNDAQLKALEHEISFAEAAIAKLEDAELESLERTDTFEAERKRATEEAEHYAKLLAEECESAAEAETALQGRLQRLSVERARVRTAVSEMALARYDRILLSRKPALATAWDQKCSACQMLIRPQKWNDLRNAETTEPFLCESCGRLLYYDAGYGTDAAKERQAMRRLMELG